MNFYNEFDPSAAAWLRGLIAAGLIPPGVVDERSITDIQPHELSAYTQCHFFAGIGGWSLALELAGVDPTRPLWTGSCPCQPYSDAGKGLGDADPRNLWPAFFRLIRECRPELVFGEQVAAAIGKGWLDRVSADLEGEGYACGAAVLGAHSVAAPHIRKRLYWVADAGGSGHERRPAGAEPGGLADAQGSGTRRRLADSIGEGLQGHAGHGDGGNEPGRLDALAAGSTAAGGDARRLANAPSLPRAQHEREPRNGSRGEAGQADGAECRGDHGGLADADRLDGDRAGSRASDDSRERQPGELRGVEDPAGRLAYPERDDRRADQPERGPEGRAADRRACGGAESGGMGDADSGRLSEHGERDGRPIQSELEAPRGADAGRSNPWSDSYWLLCRDGKHRRVPTEPALFPLADGLPYKLARRGSIRPALLKGAGNAIVPETAAEFIQAFLETHTLETA